MSQVIEKNIMIRFIYTSTYDILKFLQIVDKGNFQTTILLIPTGGMGCWVMGNFVIKKSFPDSVYYWDQMLF